MPEIFRRELGVAEQNKICKMRTRMANSLCCEWLSRHHQPERFSTSAFRSAVAAEHDRAAISLVTNAKPRLPKPKSQREPRA